MTQNKIEFLKQEFKEPKNNSYFGSIIGYKDLYYQYPYKKKHTKFTSLCTTKEETDHKYTLTYPEWCKIIDCYTKHVLKYLLTGKNVELPYRLGFLKFVKYKTTKNINWKQTNKHGKIVKQKNMMFGGYWFKIKIKRSIKIAYQNLWSVKLSKTAFKRTLKELRDNPSLMYNFDSK